MSETLPTPVATRPGSRTWLAVWALLAVTVIWGATFVWMKQGLTAAETKLGPGHTDAGVALFMLLRFGAAALILFVCVPSVRRDLDARHWQSGRTLGFLLFLGFALQMFGLDQVSPAVSAFLTSLYVLFTALISAVRARRGIRLALGVGVVCATLGAGLIRGRPELGFTLGELFSVGCAFVFALHILLTDRVTRVEAPLPVTFTTFVWTAVGSAILLGWTSLAEGAPGLRVLVDLCLEPAFFWPLALSCVFATVVAISLMNVFQRELDPVRAAILYAFEPIWAAVFAIALGLDRFTLWLVVGGAILLAGNLIAELGQGQKQAAQPS